MLTYNIVINDSTVFEPGHDITIDGGIYLDLYSNGIEVHHNTVEAPLAVGIRVNGNHNVDINNNNIFNCMRRYEIMQMNLFRMFQLPIIL